MTGVFNRPGEPSLVFSAGPGGSAGKDFPSVRDVTAQSGYVFVINLLHFFRTKATNFPPWFPHSLLSKAFPDPGRVRFRRPLGTDCLIFIGQRRGLQAHPLPYPGRRPVREGLPLLVPLPGRLTGREMLPAYGPENEPALR
jgi:hypothetical protein